MDQFHNRLQLIASLAERDATRYTPAGIPIVSAILLHRSEQVEADVPRQVEFEIPVLAAGEISGRFNRIELGETLRFTGFLARKHRNSKSLVFHVVDFGTLTDHQIQIDTGAKNGIR